MSLAFRYRAATSTGELVEGVVRASNEAIALDELRRQTLFPVSLAAEGEPSTRSSIWRGSRHDTVAAAFRTMATLLGGGAALDRVLEFSARQATHPQVRDAIASVRRDVQSGQSFATALRARPEIFGSLAPAMVRAGEESGTLDIALERLADHLERARALRAQLRDALIYPALLAVVAGLGVVVLLTFVVPRFVAMLSDVGGTLPWTTRALVLASRAVAGYWWIWLLAIAAIATGAGAWLRDPANRLRWHAIRLTLPVVGPLEWRAWTGRFTRTLGALLQGGTPVLVALRLARESVENASMASQLNTAVARVERGDRLAASLDGVLPPLATQLLAVGEESGSLDAMATRAADSCDHDVQRGLKRLVGLVEPMLIVLFGGLVGFVALAMLQAIYSINASVP